MTTTHLRNKLKNIAFLVAQECLSPQQMHDEIIGCIELVNKMDEEPTATNDQKNQHDELVEIKKVKRRLPRWKRKSYQLNTKILNAFLALQSEGQNRITAAAICEELGEPERFDQNFNQMINFGKKNHGKVFQWNGMFVEIWEPVREAVREYHNSD